MKAFILAAGLGTRLKPFTEHVPKALVEVNGKPLLQCLIEKLKQNGCTDIVINVHHFAEQVIDFLNVHQNFGLSIQISNEQEQLLDTGGAILKAQPFLEHEPYFLVHNVDILSNIDFSKIIENHLKSGALATIAVRNRNTDRKFLFDKNLHLRGWQNAKTHEKILLAASSEQLVPLAFSGIHIMNSDIFKHLHQTKTAKPSTELKFSIVETYLDLAKTLDINGFRHDEDWWVDVGKPEQLAQAQNLVK